MLSKVEPSIEICTNFSWLLNVRAEIAMMPLLGVRIKKLHTFHSVRILEPEVVWVFIVLIFSNELCQARLVPWTAVKSLETQNCAMTPLQTGVLREGFKNSSSID